MRGTPFHRYLKRVTLYSHSENNSVFTHLGQFAVLYINCKTRVNDEDTRRVNTYFVYFSIK